MVGRDALREYVRGSLWVLPGLSMLAARAAGAALSSVRVGSRSPLAFQGTPDDARPSPGPVRCSWPGLRRGQRPAPDPDRPADRR